MDSKEEDTPIADRGGLKRSRMQSTLTGRFLVLCTDGKVAPIPAARANTIDRLKSTLTGRFLVSGKSAEQDNPSTFTPALPRYRLACASVP